MCGRYVSVASTDDLYDEFTLDTVVGDGVPPSWNVAPTDAVPMVVERAPHGDEPGGKPVRQLRTARWGLVPSWSRDAKGGARMINARIETVTDKPAFKSAAARRRCLLPALGYYEWRKTDAGKTPYFLHGPDGELLAMAGLYELWRDRSRTEDDPSRWLWTCTIITQQASDVLGFIHDRNPVIVPPAMRAAWLDCSTDSAGNAGAARRLLDELPPARLAPYVVSAAVGNVANNGPQLIEPTAEPTMPGRGTTVPEDGVQTSLFT